MSAASSSNLLEVDAALTVFDRRSLLIGAGASVVLAGCTSEPAPRAPATPRAARLLAAARRQIGVTLLYDGGYTVLPFPNGDVPRIKGACTDVLVRAYRDALGLDLQALVHADMESAFPAYPQRWGLSQPDSSIDHRRVPNLGTWLRRQGASLPIPQNAAGWRPGDIFTSIVDGRGTHIGLVSDQAGPDGLLIIHNIARAVREEDGLFAWPITGRFRWSID